MPQTINPPMRDRRPGEPTYRCLLAIALGFVACALALTGCGDDSSSPDADASPDPIPTVTAPPTSPPEQPTATAPAPTSATTGTATTGPPCVVDDGNGEELRTRLPGDLPPLYSVAPDGAEDTGPFGLERAATDDGLVDGGTLLRSLRFRRGISRTWYHLEAADLDLRLYEFCEAEGATAYAEHTHERLTTELWGFREADGGELPADTIALINGRADGGGYAVVLRTHGPYLLIAGARSIGLETEAELVARAATLADTQVQTLS